MLSFYVDAGDLNSGPCACSANTLPTRLSPQLYTKALYRPAGGPRCGLPVPSILHLCLLQLHWHLGFDSLLLVHKTQHLACFSVHWWLVKFSFHLPQFKLGKQGIETKLNK